MWDHGTDRKLMDAYRVLVTNRFPHHASGWPLLLGYDLRTVGLPGGTAFIFEDTRNSAVMNFSGLGELTAGDLGLLQVDETNADQTRGWIERRYNVREQDGVLITLSKGNNHFLPPGQLEGLLHKHAQYLGLTPMRIFLSHKGVDKEMVRRFQRLLKELGFDPWLDDDAMPAGVQPDRAILQGFKDSCAAVFFVTPDFKDETWLATEVEYARAEKRAKASRFAIITLCLTKDGAQGEVPELLKNYVYKKPAHELEAFLEIVRALPLKLGEPRFR